MPARPSSSNSHLAQKKNSSLNLDVCRFWAANNDGPVAEMQQLRIISSAFLSSAHAKSPTSKTDNDESDEKCRLKETQKTGYCRSNQAESWDESSESESTGSVNEFSDSTTDDFETEGGAEESTEDVAKKEEGTRWPGASGDATNESESVLQQSGQRKPPVHRNSSVHRDASNIQQVLKTLQDTLKNVDDAKSSATRPTTPIVHLPEQQKLESRGSGDTYSRECSPWAAWFVSKQFDKKRREKEEEVERRKRAEMKERAMQEERRNLQIIAFQRWRQRKDAQREAAEKERAMQLQKLRLEEEEKLLTTEQTSKRAWLEWCRKKDREFKERRLLEEKSKAEAIEEERERKAVAEKRVKEWRKVRAGPSCALNASTFVNPKPWLNVVEIPEEETETKVPIVRPRRRTRREQEKICARLSRPSHTKTPTFNNKPEPDPKIQVSWLQRIKKRSHGRKQSEPALRCASAQPPPSRSRENLGIILSHSDYKSSASRTSEWIKSVISRRYNQEAGEEGDNLRRKSKAPQKVKTSRSKSSEKDQKPKNRTAQKGHPHVQSK